MHVVVDGEVQGVGYRYTMRIVAREAGASGWVRNRRDGTVEAEVEGETDAVDRMAAWLAQGPRSARVDAVEADAAEPRGDRGFRIA